MDNQNRIFGLRKNVFWLGIVSLINDFSSEMVYSVMPAFLTVVLGAPPVFVGFLEGFADALASFFRIISGWWSDKIRKRKIIAVSGYSLSVATRWFLALVTNFWQVFILRAIDRAGKGLRDSPRDALLSESVERRELGKSFGYQRAMDATGSILGALSAVLLLPVFFAIPAGKLADRVGDQKLIIAGFLMAVLAYLNFAYFATLFSVVAGFVSFGLYSAMTDGIMRAFASKLVPENKLATGQGFLQATIGIASLLAGVIGGTIWTQFGSQPAFLYGAVLMLIGLLVFVVYTI